MIRRACATLLLAVFALSARAQEVDAPSGAAAPRPRAGYRFDDPQLLTQQVLWGIFHGARLLGLACQARGDHRAALAYADWMERQRPRIRGAQRDLARFYFHRESAAPEAISAALGLRPNLGVAPKLLSEACATLPEALSRERYDLDRLYAERRAAIERGDPDFPGAVWKEPADEPPVSGNAESADNPRDNESQPKETP